MDAASTATAGGGAAAATERSRTDAPAAPAAPLHAAAAHAAALLRSAAAASCARPPGGGEGLGMAATALVLQVHACCHPPPHDAASASAPPAVAAAAPGQGAGGGLGGVTGELCCRLMVGLYNGTSGCNVPGLLPAMLRHPPASQLRGGVPMHVPSDLGLPPSQPAVEEGAGARAREDGARRAVGGVFESTEEAKQSAALEAIRQALQAGGFVAAGAVASSP